MQLFRRLTMRSYSIPVLLIGLIVASAGDVQAQRTGNREMNERINALRSRLQNYQLERIRSEPKKVALIEEKETVEVKAVEVKFEQLVEDFEARKDVAVTVLFHDEDFAKGLTTDNVTQVRTVENKVVAPSSDKLSAAGNSREEQVKIDPVRQLELERAQRQEKYEELRRRVHMATRRVHDQAREINGMVAKIP